MRYGRGTCGIGGLLRALRVRSFLLDAVVFWKVRACGFFRNAGFSRAWETNSVPDAPLENKGETIARRNSEKLRKFLVSGNDATTRTTTALGIYAYPRVQEVNNSYGRPKVIQSAPQWGGEPRRPRLRFPPIPD